MSEADEFAVDAPVAPGRDLGGHRDDKAPQLGRGSGAPWRPVGLGPVSGDAAAVPAKEGVGGDEPAGASGEGERGCDRAEHAPVVIVEGRPVDLAAEYAELVAQHDEFEVLRAPRTHSQTRQRRQKPVQDAIHGASGSAGSAAGQPPRPSFRHPQAASSRSPRVPPST